MQSVEWHFTVGVSAVQILGPNPNRRSLTFVGDGTNVFTLSTAGTAVIGQGYTLVPQEPGVTIDDRDIGTRIRQPWWAIANNAASSLTVFEGFT